ncbi:MAG: hypothetical protein GWN56_01070 [Nitrosopumilaceae archaeon]|nr:hypothetical protein [Nitrosopumilaceae archaeon]NIV64756.1 hypothetical protein [Nitrosopumilaceae archaeon]
MGLEELRQRIIKGEKRITENDSAYKEVPHEWRAHLAILKKRFKEEAIEAFLNKLNNEWPYGLFDWLKEHNKSLYEKNIEIERKLDDLIKDDCELDEFDYVLNTLDEWYMQALTLYRNSLNVNQDFKDTPSKGVNLEKGGKNKMGITIQALELVEPGIHTANIADIKTIDGKFGESLQVEFELEDGRSINGIFPPKATPGNRTGMLFEKALGEFRTADSDELLGKTVKILVEEKQSGDRTYSNVTKVM